MNMPADGTREYVLASGNRGKLREITAMLAPLDVMIRPQSKWQVPEAEETAPTFIENALIKARNASLHTGLASIADDSGLVVPALHGAPGIYSARYAGEGATDQANLEKLLKELRQHAGRDRRAYFFCAMVFLDSVNDPAPIVATASWHGQILRSPRGNGGFGYDPVFGILSPHQTDPSHSAAELTLEEKGSVSHRGQALTALLGKLQRRNRHC